MRGRSYEGRPRNVDEIDARRRLANDPGLMGHKRAIRTGAYVLVVRLERCVNLQVGKLGRFMFAAGVYAYVGSAMNGLDARLARHRRREKKLHWHIDYLLRHGTIVNVLEFESSDRQECQLIARVREGWYTEHPAPGFGSSDCRCTSHLHLLPPGTGTSALRP